MRTQREEEKKQQENKEISAFFLTNVLLNALNGKKIWLLLHLMVISVKKNDRKARERERENEAIQK